MFLIKNLISIFTLYRQVLIVIAAVLGYILKVLDYMHPELGLSPILLDNNYHESNLAVIYTSIIISFFIFFHKIKVYSKRDKKVKNTNKLKRR